MNGHKLIRRAAILGCCFVLAHLATIVITITAKGLDWGFNAWLLDVSGLLAGAYFAVQCWKSSFQPAKDYQKINLFILIWASLTFIARTLDVLMLFGFVKWAEIYITPTASVLYANILSEVILGTTFTFTALVGSIVLLIHKQDPIDVR
ncbi:hypothetical protein [Pseudovibrio brasiliensis]|uniref:Uncharacterized protein n=1 Tax=Pseudovibrio brasiliensis TaxID=1898042 RepID=A0ABX8ARV1_9HYPH|nr:hypothetical protein [Pseudovibrio brasiliensis]QUS56575.1 hypothetical protein KGB56_03815 [Pseudovibrio brasiliensis]